ncbi:MAG TPA: serine hydrolase domain-containing protein [Streptosporangiaceae bacterium]|jgi:CubicO group peptidase (beta-lactamase class C family)
MTEVQGTVADGFGPVRDAFAAVLERSGGGAAFAAYSGGRPLADLWGGTAGTRSGAPWTADTVVVLFSGTKGLTATVLAQLVDEGLIDPDERVAAYWPEFAAAGKADVRVRHLASHTTGLLYVDPPVDGRFGRLDNTENARRLAAQPTLWEPGTQVSYHAITYGYLVGEVIQRVTGKTVGTLLRERVAGPLGLDVHLGAPAEIDPRVAHIVRAPGYRTNTFLKDESKRPILDRMYAGILTGPDDLFNSAEMRRAELASGGGIGNARDMARLYDVLAGGGTSADGVRVVGRAGLDRATATYSEGEDAVNARPLHFGLGYELADPIATYGPAPVAFGHSGAGGGRHGAWPESGVGFSFCLNEMQSEDEDTRATTLLTALHSCL